MDKRIRLALPPDREEGSCRLLKLDGAMWGVGYRRGVSRGAEVWAPLFLAANTARTFSVSTTFICELCNNGLCSALSRYTLGKRLSLENKKVG